MTSAPVTVEPTGGADRGADRDLHALAAGSLRWLDRHLEFFDPFSTASPLPANRRIKAVLELAILCRAWHTGPDEDGLRDRATALLRRAWSHPGFAALIDGDGGPYAAAQRLAALAFAPSDPDAGLRRSLLERLRADGDLEPGGRSAQARLETRYLAELAGLPHGMGPEPELTAQTPLSRPPAAPVTSATAYGLTHTAFYLADYGRRRIDLPDDARARAVRTVAALLGSCARQDQWDLTGELVITLALLGTDPTTTPAGRAGLACLAAAQRADGLIPGRAAASGVDPALPPPQLFRRCYHPTLVVALLGVVLHSHTQAPA